MGQRDRLPRAAGARLCDRECAVVAARLSLRWAQAGCGQPYPGRARRNLDAARSQPRGGRARRGDRPAHSSRARERRQPRKPPGRRAGRAARQIPRAVERRLSPRLARASDRRGPGLLHRLSAFAAWRSRAGACLRLRLSGRGRHVLGQQAAGRAERRARADRLRQFPAEPRPGRQPRLWRPAGGPREARRHRGRARRHLAGAGRADAVHGRRMGLESPVPFLLRFPGRLGRCRPQGSARRICLGLCALWRRGARSAGSRDVSIRGARLAILRAAGWEETTGAGAAPAQHTRAGDRAETRGRNLRPGGGRREWSAHGELAHGRRHDASPDRQSVGGRSRSDGQRHRPADLGRRTRRNASTLVRVLAGRSLAMPPAIPTATYRLQLTKDFDFDKAAEVVPYLKALGITHLYASPFMTARKGSTHGYDVVDHTSLNPELGGEAGFERLSEALRQHDLGLILDFVPNHVGVHYADNPWWLDVLEWGLASPHAVSFDIDWEQLPYRKRGGVLLPILGTSYGEALERGDIELRYDADEGSFSCWYFEHRLPIGPERYGEILRMIVQDADAESSEAGRHILQLTLRYRGLRHPDRKEAPAFKSELKDITGGDEVIARGLAA